MLTILLFALEIKFVLKVMRGEFNGFSIMKQMRSPHCALFCCKALRKRLDCTSRVSPYNSFVLINQLLIKTWLKKGIAN